MATHKAELILAALAVVLDVQRNIPLGDIDAQADHQSLNDDPNPEIVEEFINPPITEWTMRPRLFIAIQVPPDGDADALITARIEAAATAIENIADQLGGLVTDLRVQQPEKAPRELWGAENMKGAELPIEIDYWSSSSLG